VPLDDIEHHSPLKHFGLEIGCVLLPVRRLANAKSRLGVLLFLRIVSGLMKPMEGEVRLGGKRIEQPGLDRGIVFQRYSLFPHLTVLGNLVLGIELRRSRLVGKLFGRRRREAVERAQRLLEAVGLAGARDRYPSQLSGGMQQRLSIAQSMICEPGILLLDEPFGALDPGITADMHKLILELWSQTAMTVFMITHDIKEGFHLGTRLLVFDKLRHDPQAPDAYGARITYDIPLRRRTEGPRRRLALVG